MSKFDKVKKEIEGDKSYSDFVFVELENLMAVFYRDLKSKELVYIFDDLVDENNQKQHLIQFKPYTSDGLFITKDGKFTRASKIYLQRISVEQLKTLYDLVEQSAKQIPIQLKED